MFFELYAAMDLTFQLTLQNSTVQAWIFNKTEATACSKQESKIKTEVFIEKFTIN